jgi:CTD kinase subunit beta
MDAPKFITRHHRPYFSLPEAETLSEKQRGKLSLNQDEKERQRACSLIEAVGTRMGLSVHLRMIIMN